MKTKYQEQLNLLIQKPVFTAQDARSLSIPSRMLAHFCELGVIERLSRGVYKSSGFETDLSFEIEDLVITSNTIPHGVICLSTALYLYNLTDQMLREYWIAVPNSSRSPKRPHTRIVRMRNMSLGITTLQLGSHFIKIFDRERTVIDAFRYLSDEIAIKALQFYLKSSSQHKPDLAKLTSYAKTLRVKITPYIMALTT